MSNLSQATGGGQFSVIGGGTFPNQDFVLIGGEKSPGKATILRPNSPRGWDVRQGYALTGATVIPKGNPLGEFDILFELWNAATQIDAWYAYAAKYFDEGVRLIPGSLTPKALGIFHPVLAAPPIRITEVVITNATGLERDEYGLHSCLVSCMRYRKPKPALLPPSGAIPAAGAAAPTAQDAADVEMQQKLEEFTRLAG